MSDEENPLEPDETAVGETSDSAPPPPEAEGEAGSVSEDLSLRELDGAARDPDADSAEPGEGDSRDEGEAFSRNASDLEAVFDIPVRVSAILGKSQLQVSDLLKLSEGEVIELDRKVGEAIDIFVNNRLVARGEVVLVEDRLGVTMTEIIKAE